MVKKSKKDTTKEGVKEVVVKKPDEVKPETITSTQPSTNNETALNEITAFKKEVLEIIKPKDPEVIEIPKPKRKPRTKKIIETKVIETLPEKKNYDKYVYIFIAVLIGSALAYYLYLRLKEYNDPKAKEDRLLQRLADEGLLDVSNVKKFE